MQSLIRLAGRMPRFHFHIRDGEDLVADLVGSECENVEAALGCAVTHARSAAHESRAKGQSIVKILDKSLFITDGAGSLISVAPVYEVAFLPGYRPSRVVRAPP